MEKFDVFATKFAHDTFVQKYSMDKTETWADTSKRVVEAVCGQLLSSKEKNKIYKIILDRKFIPGGRYLYSAGRAFHQISNCFLFRAEDSREGWAEIMQKATAALMTGGGIGVDYSLLRERGAIIRRTGGKSTGPIALMEMVNEAGRHIMQGGSRRSAIWAGLNWKHPDISTYLHLKDWSTELRELKEKDIDFRLPMEGTNISVIYDTGFFVAIENEDHPDHLLAKKVWLENCKQAFKTAEPGMSFNFRKDNESLRNAPVSARTRVLTIDGYRSVGDIIDQEVRIWTGKQWAATAFKLTKENSELVEVGLSNGRSIICDPEHPFISEAFINGRNCQLRVAAQQLIVGQTVLSVAPQGEVSEVYVTKVQDLDYRENVYCCDVKVEEHSFMAEGVIISNCTEVVSEDDSDKCNLGTVWMNRCADKDDFAETVKYATLFLLCGGIYSDVPNEKIRQVGLKNNRIGLGLGGMHEWLMLKGYEYECPPELFKWLNDYEEESDAMAFVGAKQLGVSVPKGVRSIAPTGTIGIIAETTTGIEPLFCKAYKRRYRGPDDVPLYQYVVDGSVKRLMAAGISLDKIKDSFDLSFRQRVKFQADVQKYVDMSISSTCNMSHWGSETNNENTVEKHANTLLRYAKRLRGFTVYPDGARTGQPLTRVSLEEALASEGVVFEEKEDACVGGVCGV